ncbi:unnamed protein product [Sympodiomycopsis kandeliae]
MAPKPAKNLGPLAGRTLKGPSSATGPHSSSSPSSSSPRRPAAGNSNSPSKNVLDSPSGSTRRPSNLNTYGEDEESSPPSYLLEREYETTFHRNLRRLLESFVNHREEWEDEVIEMAEFVGKYSLLLGEIEDELKETNGAQGKGKSPRRTRGSDDDGDESGSDSGSDSESDQEEQSSLWKPSSTSTLLSSLKELDTTYHQTEKGKIRVTKQEHTLIKIKDELNQLRKSWWVKNEDVKWGLRSGNEFVDASNVLILQVQLQTQQLLDSLDMLYTTCSPLGSLRASKQRYNLDKASEQRKKILTIWRDLPLVERGAGNQGLTFWKMVYKAEIGRWKE